MPSVSSSPPNGKHMSATMRANQPVLVRAPVVVKPPRTVINNRTESKPAPTMEPPHCSSWRVPSWAGVARGKEGFCGGLADIVLSLREPQHHVGDHAGDGDIQPEWKCPSGDFAVLRKAAREREEKGDKNEWQRDHSEQDVTCKQPEIEGAIRDVQRVADVAVQRVVEDVAHEKQARKGESRNHGCAMGCDAAGTNEGVADEQENGGEAVENGVQRGKEGVFAAG